MSAVSKQNQQSSHLHPQRACRPAAAPSGRGSPLSTPPTSGQRQHTQTAPVVDVKLPQALARPHSAPVALQQGPEAGQALGHSTGKAALTTHWRHEQMVDGRRLLQGQARGYARFCRCWCCHWLQHKIQDSKRFQDPRSKMLTKITRSHPR
jgi:hypothetical protein